MKHENRHSQPIKHCTVTGLRVCVFCEAARSHIWACQTHAHWFLSGQEIISWFSASLFTQSLLHGFKANKTTRCIWPDLLLSLDIREQIGQSCSCIAVEGKLTPLAKLPGQPSWNRSTSMFMYQLNLFLQWTVLLAFSYSDVMLLYGGVTLEMDLSTN